MLWAGRSLKIRESQSKRAGWLAGWLAREEEMGDKQGQEYWVKQRKSDSKIVLYLFDDACACTWVSLVWFFHNNRVKCERV